MVALREVFSRFRPVAVPGGAGPGAPADRGAEQDAELSPVFASLRDAEAEAARLRAEGAAQAAEIRAAGAARAAAIVREALDRAPGEQQEAVRRARAEAEEYCAARMRESGERAERLRARALPLVDPFVERFVAEALRRLLNEHAETGR